MTKTDVLLFCQTNKASRALLLIPPHGTPIETLTPDSSEGWSLAEIQGLVGGYFELVSISNGACAIVNEDGNRLRLPYNPVASSIAGMKLVGSVLFCHPRALE